jgi:hypothetical protein
MTVVATIAGTKNLVQLVKSLLVSCTCHNFFYPNLKLSFGSLSAHSPTSHILHQEKIDLDTCVLRSQASIYREGPTRHPDLKRRTPPK